MYKQFKDECQKRVEVQNNEKIWKNTHDWMFKDENMWKYSYNFEWLGRPIIQYPQDIVAFQELVWNVKPDLIIETGIAHGGSLILSASMLLMLEYTEALNTQSIIDPKSPKKMVLGIDIDVRGHNRKAIEEHPLSNRIKMIEGSSIDKNIVNQVYEYSKDFKRILLCLDSNHTHQHVLEELKLYTNLVSVGSYCIVFDTIVEHMPDEACTERPWGKGNNPKTAVHEFLKENDSFEIDKNIQNKLLITVALDGYLKRIK